jgi:hexosaminidase
MTVDRGWDALIALLAAGVISGLASMALFRKWSKPVELRRASNRLLAHLMEFHLFADDPVLILKAQRDLIRANLKVLRYMALPGLLTAIPVAVVCIVCEAVFGKAPLPVGGSTVLTVQYETDSPGDAAVIKTPAGIEVDAGPVHVTRERQVSWRLHSRGEAEGNVVLAIGGNRIAKSIAAGPVLRWTSERRSRLGGFLLHPYEEPLLHPPARWISVEYAAASVFGWPWMVWFGIGCLVGSATVFAAPARWFRRTGLAMAMLLACGAGAHAETVSPLFARGYPVIPEPQQVNLEPGSFHFGSDWSIDTGAASGPVADTAQTLETELKERCGIPTLSRRDATQKIIELRIATGSVEPGPTRSEDRAAIAEQSYRLTLQPTKITITANASLGLFYGVQTLVQLAAVQKGELPRGGITDWPELPQRHIYWDDAHHLERLEDLKSAIRDAAYFKINGFALKLEGHFQYSSAPALVEPQALSSAEFQDLTNYGLRHHVELIPYLDAPGHIAFILKHPEYAKLRAFPDSNYEMCTTNPEGMKLLHGMYKDLIDASQGGKYVYLSTDEAYYVGWANNAQCDETKRAAELGSRGKLLAEFVSQLASYLKQRGREVIFWGEYPLKPNDIPSLPPYLINGETYGPKFDPVFRKHGIREMIYQSVEGEERLFPHYFMLPPSGHMHHVYEDYERVPAAFAGFAKSFSSRDANLIGTVVAGWGDMGLHPQTFWLGYATVTASGWRPWSAGAAEAMSSFYPLWFGTKVVNMGRLFQLMSYQTQIWNDTWDTVDSSARKGIWGDSNKIFKQRQPARDQTIPLPPIPGPDLSYTSDWNEQNARRLQLASDASGRSDELLGLLGENLIWSEFHRYDLEVFASIARLCRQNLDMFSSFERADEALQRASREAKAGRAAKAVEAVDQALAEIRQIRTDRNDVLHDATETWYKSWLPRIVERDGRRFLHEVDDVKDHLPDRTVDMSYLVYRELQLPLEAWYRKAEESRNLYAAAHQLEAQHTELGWDQL